MCTDVCSVLVQHMKLQVGFCWQDWTAETAPGQDSGGALQASRYMSELTRHLSHCRYGNLRLSESLRSGRPLSDPPQHHLRPGSTATVNRDSHLS